MRVRVRVRVYDPSPPRSMDDVVVRSMDDSTRARETTADAESGGDGGIFFLSLIAPIVRPTTRSIDDSIESSTRIARAMDGDDDSMIRARVVSTRRRSTPTTRTVTTMYMCAFFAGVARGTETTHAPAWSGALESCAGGESSSSATTTTNARGDVVAVGDAACASGGRGVTFRSRGERLVSTSTTNGAIEAVRAGAAAARLRSPSPSSRAPTRRRNRASRDLS